MKLVKKYKGFGIYDSNKKELAEGSAEFYIFCPNETPQEFFSPEFECCTLKECMKNIDSY